MPEKKTLKHKNTGGSKSRIDYGFWGGAGRNEVRMKVPRNP